MSQDYCTEGDRCVCGGDTDAVRATCRNWRAAPKAEAPAAPAERGVPLTDEQAHAIAAHYDMPSSVVRDIELAVRRHLLANKPRNDDGDDEEGTGRDAGRD